MLLICFDRLRRLAGDPLFSVSVPVKPFTNWSLSSSWSPSPRSDPVFCLHLSPFLFASSPSFTPSFGPLLSTELGTYVTSRTASLPALSFVPFQLHAFGCCASQLHFGYAFGCTASTSHRQPKLALACNHPDPFRIAHKRCWNLVSILASDTLATLHPLARHVL